MNGLFNDFKIPLQEKICNDFTIDKKEFHKMLFVWKALENGWKIKKIKDTDTYIFTKKHEGKKEVFQDSYLEKFILSNLET